MEKKRLINCDILRILAFLFVISVHSISYIGFYSTINEGPTMWLLNILRCLFIICVPLFILLTGYFMSKKELNKSYLKKIIRIIITYLICSILCFIIINLMEGNKGELTIPKYIAGILSYSAAPYAWYVNMYLSLFLIIPFLNIAWNNLKDKKQRQHLLLIVFIIGILPNAVNIFNLQDPSWWLNPSSSRAYHQLVPNFFEGPTYVLLYYYLGCYLKEYKLNLSIRKSLIFLLITLLVNGTFNYYRNYNAYFEWGSYVGYASLESLIVTILFVNIILRAYLVSAIFDRWFYPILNANTRTLTERLPYLLLMVPTTFICSLIVSYLVELLISLSKKVIIRVKNKIDAKKVA